METSLSFQNGNVSIIKLFLKIIYNNFIASFVATLMIKNENR